MPAGAVAISHNLTGACKSLLKYSSLHMRSGTCDVNHEDGGDGKCVQSCESDSVLNTESGACVPCGGASQPVCSDGTPPHVMLRFCYNIARCTSCLATLQARMATHPGIFTLL